MPLGRVPRVRIKTKAMRQRLGSRRKFQWGSTHQERGPREKTRRYFSTTPAQFERMKTTEVNQKGKVTGRPRIIGLMRDGLEMIDRRKGKNERRVRQIGKVLIEPGVNPPTNTKTDTTVIRLTHPQFNRMLKKWAKNVKNNSDLKNVPYVFSRDQTMFI